jgi:hypothetical protein
MTPGTKVVVHVSACAGNRTAGRKLARVVSDDGETLLVSLAMFGGRFAKPRTVTAAQVLREATPREIELRWIT